LTSNPRENDIRISGETTTHVAALRLTVKEAKWATRAGIYRLPVTGCHTHQH